MQRSHSLKYEATHLPRGWVLLGFAVLSWGLALAAWNGLAASLGLIFG